jgi:hypothetical protein
LAGRGGLGGGGLGGVKCYWESSNRGQL